jgi:hypothetical protein
MIMPIASQVQPDRSALEWMELVSAEEYQAE